MVFNVRPSCHGLNPSHSVFTQLARLPTSAQTSEVAPASLLDPPNLCITEQEASKEGDNIDLFYLIQDPPLVLSVVPVFTSKSAPDPTYLPAKEDETHIYKVDSDEIRGLVL
jgi:hypothetical protein